MRRVLAAFRHWRYIGGFSRQGVSAASRPSRSSGSTSQRRAGVVLEGVDEGQLAVAVLSQELFRDQPADHGVTKQSVEVSKLADLCVGQTKFRHLEIFRSNHHVPPGSCSRLQNGAEPPSTRAHQNTNLQLGRAPQNRGFRMKPEPQTPAAQRRPSVKVASSVGVALTSEVRRSSSP